MFISFIILNSASFFLLVPDIFFYPDVSTDQSTKFMYAVVLYSYKSQRQTMIDNNDRL